MAQVSLMTERLEPKLNSLFRLETKTEKIESQVETTSQLRSPNWARNLRSFPLRSLIQITDNTRYSIKSRKNAK